MPFTIGGDWTPKEEDQKKRMRSSRPVKVRKEKRGKAVVTLVLNLQKTNEELKELAAMLKKKCSCGGTVKEGVIEIQGDRIEIIQKELKAIGIKPH